MSDLLKIVVPRTAAHWGILVYFLNFEVPYW